LTPKIDENGIFGPKIGSKRIKKGKNEEFLKKRPLTKNYTLLSTTYFYKIKINIFKKSHFGPKGPKMKKQKLPKNAKIAQFCEHS